MKHVFIIIVTFVCLSAYTQNFSSFPENFIMRNTMFPSLTDYLESPDLQKMKLSVYSKQRTGLFKEVRSAQINGQYSFKKNNLGVHIVSNRKGKFIRRNRVYINYATHIRIDRNKYVAGGISLGAINYSISSNTGGPSGSDVKPDASFGLAYYDKKNTVNLTFNQLSQPTLSPIYEIMTLPRFIQALILRKYSTGDRWSGHVYGRVDVYSNYYKQFSAGNKILFNDQVSVGISFNSDAVMFACLGLKYETERKAVFDLFLGYQTQTGLLEDRYNVSSFNIGVIFFQKK